MCQISLLRAHPVEDVVVNWQEALKGFVEKKKNDEEEEEEGKRLNTTEWNTHIDKHTLTRAELPEPQWQL